VHSILTVLFSFLVFAQAADSTTIEQAITDALRDAEYVRCYVALLFFRAECVAWCRSVCAHRVCYCILCRSEGVLGKDMTPFLLQRINELTGGASLRSSTALCLVLSLVQCGERSLVYVCAHVCCVCTHVCMCVCMCSSLLFSSLLFSSLLHVDIALVKSNARVGTLIAVSLAALR
jgi:Indigoidine synthase A like protein